jgi:hypothetical protein
LLSHNREVIDFSKVLDIEVDAAAYSHDENGLLTHNDVATQKTKSHDVNKIVNAINSIPTESQCVLALSATLAHPNICAVAKAVSFDPSIETILFSHLQLTMLIQQLYDIKSHQNGRLMNNVEAMVQALYMVVALSPNHNDEAELPSNRKLVAAMGLPRVTGHWLMKKAKVIHGATKTNPKKHIICYPKRKGFTKITPVVIKAVHIFVKNHDFIKPLPIMNNMLLIKNPATGEKERVPKLLLEILVRELHNDLVEAAELGDIPEVVDHNGKIVVSDSSFC